MSASLSRRLAVAAVALVLMSVALRAVSRQERVPPREAFSDFPGQIGAWTTRKAPDFDRRVLDVLGVDDYVNRTATSGQALLGLYIGYWGSQRHGDTIHSPLNCLPGSGWEPVSRGTADISVDGPGGRETISVNRIVIEKGLERQLVLYWYQSRQRVVASEYTGKVYTVLDAVRYNRSDAAIVRVVSPIAGTSAEALKAAEGQAVEFVRALFPVLPRFLPV